MFILTLTNLDGQAYAQFEVLPAAGPGYEGRSRAYDLDYASNLLAPGWLLVPGYSNLSGNHAFILCTNPPPAGAAPIFFRVRARLE